MRQNPRIIIRSRADVCNQGMVGFSLLQRALQEGVRPAPDYGRSAAGKKIDGLAVSAHESSPTMNP